MFLVSESWNQSQNQIRKLFIGELIDTKDKPTKNHIPEIKDFERYFYIDFAKIFRDCQKFK